jgi:glycogen debranching enzyme
VISEAEEDDVRPGQPLDSGIPPQSTNGESAPNPFYIQTPSALADERTRVLKHGDTFAVFDHLGDVKPTGLGEEGLYHDGTRYLSCLLLLLERHRPLFLSSTVKDHNDLLTVDLTNPDLLNGTQLSVPRGTLHIFRSKFLWGAACYERLRVKNFGLTTVDASFALHFRADFADIFEVRGTQRPQRGKYFGASIEGSSVVFRYQGLDGVERRTRLTFDPAPSSVQGTEVSFHVALPPHGEADFETVVHCERDAPTGEAADLADADAESTPPTAAAPSPTTRGYDPVHARAAQDLAAAQRDACTISTSDVQFNEWLNRAAADLTMMTTRLPTGPYPYAGVPWFSTPFGRDGLLTALECLWVDPAMARGVLAFLAETQAREVDPAHDAEPGKILHEARGGEMAALSEVPFGRYYGSVDATPLFVWLAGEYYQRTGDRDFVASIRPNVDRALQWIDTFGDRDHDGFVEYLRTSPNGLEQQGWKDSHDSVFHADGSMAQGPIALCEVQGYVYAARLAGGELAELFGDTVRADDLRRRAADLRLRFGRAFWCDDLGTYALALDGDKRPCRVRTSNPGHCLLTGIADPDPGTRCGRTLVSATFFTGWGIRTVAHGEARYNPMSYHNGSVWPHDNALAAAGLARYGLRAEALLVLNGLFDVSKAVDLHRLPELFCGFSRRPGEGPTSYPVACSPQAWSAASVFLLLQAYLGLSIRTAPAEVCFTRPLLPESLRVVQINNLRVGSAAVDLRLRAEGEDVHVEVLRRVGDIRVRFG